MNPRRQTDDRIKFDLIGDSAAYIRRVLRTELQPAWVGYVVAALLNGILTLLLLAFEPVFPLSHFPIFYTLATAAVAYWFGFFPAVFAFILSSTMFVALFVHTEGPWWHLRTDAAGLAGIVAFLVGTVVGGFGSLMIRSSRERIQHLAERLAATNERLASVLESVTDAFLALDRNWRFTYVNPAAGRLLDRTPHELLGRIIWEELHDAVDSAFHRETHRAMEERITVELEEYYPRIGRWLEIRAYPSSEGLAVYLQDVTERRRVEEAIKEAEQHRTEFYRRTLLAATGGKLVMTGRAQIEAIAGPPVGAWDVDCPEDLRKVRGHVADVAAEAGLSEERISKLCTCVGEATTNALKHGGRGKASVHTLPDSLMVVVQDQGPGIEELNLPDVALTLGFSTAGTLGMGYKVMLSFADKVYLATGDEGTVVAVEMKLQPEEDALNVPEIVKICSRGEHRKC